MNFENWYDFLAYFKNTSTNNSANAPVPPPFIDLSEKGGTNYCGLDASYEDLAVSKCIATLQALEGNRKIRGVRFPEISVNNPHNFYHLQDAVQKLLEVNTGIQQLQIRASFMHKRVSRILTVDTAEEFIYGSAENQDNYSSPEEFRNYPLYESGIWYVSNRTSNKQASEPGKIFVERGRLEAMHELRTQNEYERNNATALQELARDVEKLNINDDEGENQYTEQNDNSAFQELAADIERMQVAIGNAINTSSQFSAGNFMYNARKAENTHLPRASNNAEAARILKPRAANSSAKKKATWSDPTEDAATRKTNPKSAKPKEIHRHQARKFRFKPR